MAPIQDHIRGAPDQLHPARPPGPVQPLDHRILRDVPAPPPEDLHCIQHHRRVVYLILPQQGDVIGTLVPVGKGLTLQPGGQHHGLDSQPQTAVQGMTEILKQAVDTAALLIEDNTAARLDDPRLFLGNLLYGVPQQLSVFQADVGDDRRLGGRDDVGGVQPSSQSGLQHHKITL